MATAIPHMMMSLILGEWGEQRVPPVPHGVPPGAGAMGTYSRSRIEGHKTFFSQPGFQLMITRPERSFQFKSQRPT